MRIRQMLILSLMLLMLLWVEPRRAKTQTTDQGAGVVVRVGVITVTSYESTYAEYQDLFARMSQLGSKVRFQIAVGSYDDVLDWYQNGFIDLAILTPGPVAELLVARNQGVNIRDLYICSKSLRPAPADSIVAVPERRLIKPHFEYHAACLVKKDSLKDVAEFEQKARDGKLKFLFVHPLSVSGRILPEYYLQQKDIKLTKNKVEWTYSHKESARILAQPDSDGYTKVAFMADSEAVDPEYVKLFKKLPIPEMDQIQIPQEVVFISSSFNKRDENNKQLIRNLFLDKRLSPDILNKKLPPVYDVVEGWDDHYMQTVVKWLAALKIRPDKLLQQHLSLKQIGAKLREYESSHPGKTRLALVLSGGGAKCAYQLGAIQAIENELDNYRQPQNKDKRFVDIGLVVGTSGGAINALCVALGLTRQVDGQDALRATWLSFKQTDFLRPWTPVPIILGLIIGLLQVLLTIMAVRLCDNQQINWSWPIRITVIILTLITLALVVTSALSLTSSSWVTIPIMATMVVVGLKLFENPVIYPSTPDAANSTSVTSQATNWRLLTGIALTALGILEMVLAWKADWTPWRYMPEVLMLCVGLLQALVVILYVRMFTANWFTLACIILAILLPIEFFVLLYWKNGWLWMQHLGKDHTLHHGWLFLTLNLWVTAISLLVLGLLMLLAEWKGIKHLFERLSTSNHRFVKLPGRGIATGIGRIDHYTNSRRPILIRVVILLAALSIIQVTRSLFRDDSISTSSGIDHALVEKLPKLLEHHPKLKGTIIKPQGKDDKARLQDISKTIMQGETLFERDLVITSSQLRAFVSDQGQAKSVDESPDLYFYYDHPGTGSDQTLPPDKGFPPNLRFKPFTDDKYSPLLLDVVIGSTSIYPVFQPRKLEQAGSTAVPGNSEVIEIIDGGFAHNSPIEAAALWEPTHIILIEASPEEIPYKSSYLLNNAFAAFNYLFNQAQLVDARYRGKVEIFSLRPSLAQPNGDPNLCTFDFSDVLMEGAIDNGLSDAMQVNDPKFRRERAQPLF